MTPAAAAAELGVSPETVRRWAREGRISGVRVGGRLRLEQESIRRMAEPIGGDGT